MKKCIKCDIDKDNEHFYTNRNVCKECISTYRKKWVENNKDIMNNHSRKWRENNLDKCKTLQKNWYENNKDKVKTYRKDYIVENNDKVKDTWKKYREKNKEKMKVKRKEYSLNNRKRLNLYMVNLRKNNPNIKLSHNIRGRIRQFLKSRNMLKNNKTFLIIGCTQDELKKYIELQFSEGMSWENYGYYGWHIDHKIPLDSGKTEEEIYKLCHYTNLQPMWWNDNLRKSNKVIK